MATDYPKIFWDSRFKDAAPVASSTATGYNVLNINDWRPFTWFKPATLPATITVNCGAAKAADYMLVWGHDLFTKGCTVELRGSTDNFSTSNVLVATKTPTNNDPFVVLFNSVSYRYWRFNITGTAAPSIAIAVAGLLLDIPSYLSEGFDPVGRKIIGMENRSVAGHPIGRVIRYEEFSEELKFPLVTWSWIRATWLTAWRAHIVSEPFAFSWDPVNHLDELFLLMVMEDFKTPHRSGGYADLIMTVRGVSR